MVTHANAEGTPMLPTMLGELNDLVDSSKAADKLEQRATDALANECTKLMWSAWSQLIEHSKQMIEQDGDRRVLHEC